MKKHPNDVKFMTKVILTLYGKDQKIIGFITHGSYYDLASSCIWQAHGDAYLAPALMTEALSQISKITAPNKVLQTTIMAVTPAAAHPSRQP